jgi:methylphosphotriester-DNA--protein-cysteine methyltransferase
MNDKRKIEEPVSLDFSFEEAMARVAQTNPIEVAALVQTAVPEATIEDLIDQFEEAGHDNGGGDKCWFARDLMVLLGFERWETFERAIGRAKTACANSGHDPADHFMEVFRADAKNPEGGRPAKNYELTRYACYLIAQNASSRKKQVAFAQTYFAIQTRRQELADQNGVDFSSLSQAHQRLYLRNQVVEENKRLASTAMGAGVDGKAFGKFQNRGYQGLYGGMGADEIRDYKGLPRTAKILDHMEPTELAANLFRITQTEEKLRSREIKVAWKACDAHYEVGQKVRQTMRELSGILPEDLPVEEDVKRIAAAERKQQKQRAIAVPAPAPALSLPKTAPEPVCIDLRADLWKYALLIMSVRPKGEISTSDMIAEMPSYVHLSEEHTEANASRKDSKFSQIVRNLKSHKNSKTNFIYQGYVQDIPGGFKITRKGLDFVREYFKN